MPAVGLAPGAAVFDLGQVGGEFAGQVGRGRLHDTSLLVCIFMSMTHIWPHLVSILDAKEEGCLGFV